MQIRQLRNERLNDDDFFQERKEVLGQWPTGRDVDLDDGIAYQKSLPDEKVYAWKLRKAKHNGDTLVHSFNGSPTIESQIELVRYMVKEGGADLCTAHIDAFTRNQMFQKAAEAVEETRKTGKPMLNGFPLLIHSVADNRRLIEAIPVPSQISGCSCDWRLTAEVGFAGGHTSICAGPFQPFFCYNRDTSIEAAIRNWQYIYRLIGYYEERDVQIVNRPDGVLAGFILNPPCVGDACRIIESLLGARQGVKRFSLDSSTAGNLAQDLASAIVLSRLAREYLDRFGFNDVELFTMCNGMTGRFPPDHSRAFAVISVGPLVAALAGLQEFCTVTIDEAHELPTKENNAASLRCVKMVINLYKGQKLGLEETGEVKAEVRMQEMEMRAIVDRVLELGEGDPAVGSVKAVEMGVLDVPYGMARGAARRVIGVRDSQGAIRFLDHGNLPFSKEIVDYNREKIAERGRQQHREISYEAVINDIFSMAEGRLISV